MTTMVPGYQHRPGNHCGSTALRNLLAFHGTKISEEMAFGLGAGPAFFYIAFDELSPTRWVAGRTSRLEENFLNLTGETLELQTFDGPEESWEAARASVEAGRPALLLSDLYFLDHYGNSAHFPGHAVVLAGFDDEVSLLSDTAFEELQSTKLENLAKARHSAHPAYPLAGHMFTVRPGADLGTLADAVPAAIAQAAKEMINPSLGELSGLPALERFANEVADWPKVAGDWQWAARFSYQVIEKRGSGGANFRRMYARFLTEVGREDGSALCVSAAEAWSSLADAFRSASERDEPETGTWELIGERATLVRDAEQELWGSLAAS